MLYISDMKVVRQWCVAICISLVFKTVALITTEFIIWYDY